MEEMFLADIANSTEIVLSGTRLQNAAANKSGFDRKEPAGSMRKATASALTLQTSISSAIRKRALGPAESRLLAIVGAAFSVGACCWCFFPRGASTPLVNSAVYFWRSLPSPKPSKGTGPLMKTVRIATYNHPQNALGSTENIRPSGSRCDTRT